MYSMIMNSINNRYGSKRGLFNSAKYKILFLLGKYKKYQEVNYAQVEHLVFICSGNICRSPLAEFTAKSLGMSSESFGLHCRGDDLADARAIQFAKGRAIDLSTHLTRNIKNYEPKSSDLIIAMEPAHILELESLGLGEFQITTLPIFAINNIYLHDPYNSQQLFFEQCEAIVMEGVFKIKDNLKKTTLDVSSKKPAMSEDN